MSWNLSEITVIKHLTDSKTLHADLRVQTDGAARVFSLRPRVMVMNPPEQTGGPAL